MATSPTPTPLLEKANLHDEKQSPTSSKTVGCTTTRKDLTGGYIARRNRGIVYLDSSSSYYTSESLSSLDLAVAPVPPIPEGIIASMARGFSTQAATLNSLSASSSAQLKSLNEFIHGEIQKRSDECMIMPATSSGSGCAPLSSTFQQTHEDLVHETSHQNVSLYNDEYEARTASLSIPAPSVSEHEVAKVKDNGSIFWETGASKRPLLAETGVGFIPINKKWNLSSDKLDKRWGGVSHHKKSHSNEASVDNVKLWLEEQQYVNTGCQPPINLETA
ncbi:hypothetical protein BDZ91DRAFT_710038 [Kalaharituber pfeilii]|nr:hypothetical protein BDZ91DRAFT_710038 [Kalaharituber pfeilii]